MGGDDQAGAVLGGGDQRVGHLVGGGAVEVGGRLVGQDDVDAGIDRPGDGQPPRFAAGNAGAVFAEAGFDAARQTGKDVLGRRGLQRRAQLVPDRRGRR